MTPFFKICLLGFFITCSFFTNAQELIKPSSEFVISGDIVKEKKISINDLDSFQEKSIDDVSIINHAGIFKEKISGLKGILLKDILQKVTLNAAFPKNFSEYYFVFLATDGYKVVYSWNEIFNAETGNHLFLITQKNGFTIKNMPDRMLILTTSDFKTGRRHIKGLNSIIVKRS